MSPTPEEIEAKAGIVPSHGISVDLPEQDDARPAGIRHMSSPTYESPLRHHRKKQSTTRHVKETLHARSEYSNSQDDGGAIHRINQYIIKDEIGRGSFGAVHLAVDQHGTQYAVKEFSKSRLRKRAQSNILRRPHHARTAGQIAAGLGFNSPLHRHSSADIQDQEEGGNPLFLIKEEIAIMKKLDHVNLVSLIEVLDDPNEDSLYMVLEMCKKGVVMKVGVDERADPYDDESCRCWFRDLILGIEYLHAQGVVHRDIKPDNLLLTEDDVLKIVDFGVSEMFEKQSEMLTAKSAGSPAFLPPELCVAKHGDISGKAADIWSMGITLYCLRFGRIPFEQAGVLQLYESIKKDQVDFDSENEVGEDFKDLIYKVLEKDPAKRIKMTDLRKHPWVTKNGSDPLLSEEENTANLVEPPTEEETNQAITGNLGNVLSLMKAVKRFKNAISQKRPPGMNAILGQAARVVEPPESLAIPEERPAYHKSRSEETHDREPTEQVLAREGVHRDPPSEDHEETTSEKAEADNDQTPPDRISGLDRSGSDPTKRELNANPGEHKSTRPILIHRSTDHTGKGQAHDPLSEHLYLALGTANASRPPSPPAVSESPPAADSNIYETAYDKEIQRLRSLYGRSTTLFLTRRVENKEEYRTDGDLIRGGGSEEDESNKSSSSASASAKGGIAKLVEQAKAAKDIPSNLAGESQSKSSPPENEEGNKSNAANMIRNIFTKQ